SSHRRGTNCGEMHSSSNIFDIDGLRAGARPTYHRMRRMIQTSEYYVVLPQIRIVRQNVLSWLAASTHLANVPNREPGVFEHGFASEGALLFFNTAEARRIQVDARPHLTEHLRKIKEQRAVNHHSIAACDDKSARLVPDPVMRVLVPQVVFPTISRGQ